MPHEAVPDREGWAVWIAGSPGVGYNTVGEILQGRSIEMHGYRSSHQRPLEWNIAVEVIRYEITNPEAKNPFWYGFGQNWSDIASLPWRRIAVLVVADEALTERVLKFRRDNHLRVDQDDVFVRAALQTQQMVLAAMERSRIAVALDASVSPRELARHVRVLFNQGGKDVKS